MFTMCDHDTVRNKDASLFGVDVRHDIRRSLHHPVDGRLLAVLWPHLQRLLQQILQHLRLTLERQL